MKISTISFEKIDLIFRLFIRGIDDDGSVANYVETEQILQLNDVACSYVQVKIYFSSFNFPIK